ncbi:MAG: Trm112 family protein [Rickettsiales bacterium]|nr:Trm112 family protein [Rickettsiales bacterium]
MTQLNPALLDILVCPKSKAGLIYDEVAQELVCKESGLAYPVRDGIPIMLEDEARKLNEDDSQA